MVFLSLLLFVSMVQTTETATNAADHTQFRRLEAEWNDAHLRGDASVLNRLCGDDVVIVVPGMRIMTKSDALGMLQPGRMTFERYDTSQLQIRVYDQMAVVTGRLRRTRVIADKKAEDEWRFTKSTPVVPAVGRSSHFTGRIWPRNNHLRQQEALLGVETFWRRVKRPSVQVEGCALISDERQGFSKETR